VNILSVEQVLVIEPVPFIRAVANLGCDKKINWNPNQNSNESTLDRVWVALSACHHVRPHRDTGGRNENVSRSLSFVPDVLGKIKWLTSLSDSEAVLEIEIKRHYKCNTMKYWFLLSYLLLKCSFPTKFCRPGPPWAWSDIPSSRPNLRYLRFFRLPVLALQNYTGASKNIFEFVVLIL